MLYIANYVHIIKICPHLQYYFNELLFDVQKGGGGSL